MYILSEMLKHPLGEEYDYQEKKWVNDTMSCGCLIEKCINISPSDEDIDIIDECFNKKNILISYVKNKIGVISKHVDEIEKVNTELKNFIKLKRKLFKFDSNINFNGEYYFVKLKQGQNCESNN